MAGKIATALVRELDKHVSSLRTPADAMQYAGHHCAAAGLMRCRALLLGVQNLCAAQHERNAGILLRAIWETWLVSVWTLFKGLDGACALAAGYLRHTDIRTQRLNLDRTFVEEARRRIADIREIGGEVSEQPSFERMAQEVERFIGDTGQHLPVLEMYDILYRGESATTVHAGFLSIAVHMRSGDGDFGVIADPPPHLPATQVLALATGVTIDLARLVFIAFRLDGRVLDLLWRAVDVLTADVIEARGKEGAV